MAVTKIWTIKDSLQRVLDYAANPDKTEYDALAQTLHYAVCIPVFAHKLPLFTQSLPEFPAISCLVHPQFIFILHDRIYRGPYYRPQLEELLCTKPNSRATPKRRPALYMP